MRSHNKFTNKPDLVLFCENLRRALTNNKCSEDVYFWNVTGSIVGGSESTWPACLDSIPRGLERRYLEYLRREVVAHDYMPYPEGEPLGDNAEEVIERIKAHRRPKYVALVALVERRLA